MKIKTKIVLLFLIILLVTSNISYAASGLSEIYWMSPPCGVGPGGTSSIQSSLAIAGYNAKRYQNTHAYYVRRTMDDDIVFAIVTHGSPGRVYCDNLTTMSGSAVVNDDYNYSLAAFFGSGDLYKMKFAYYGTCRSARTDPVYGNLPLYTTKNLSAKCALGFDEDILDAHATYFESELFKNLSDGEMVVVAANAAKAATFIYYSEYGYVDSYSIYGLGSTQIN